MDRRSISCCFSGHRPSKLPWLEDEADPRCIALKEELSMRLDGIYHSGYRNFISGMAMGCDTYFAEAVLSLREEYPEVTLEAAIPCGSQPNGWSLEHRRKYNSLIDRCDEVKVLQYEYSRDCMMRRNKYMVDNSSLLLACFDGKPGGTMNTIVYAQRQGIKVLLIDI